MPLRVQQKVDIMFEMADWLEHEEAMFLQILRQAKKDGKLVECNLEEPLLGELTNELMQELEGKSFSRKKVRKKFYSLLQRFEKLNHIRKHGGVSLDMENCGRMSTNNKIWEDVIRHEPYARRVQERGDDLMLELVCLFGHLQQEASDRQFMAELAKVPNINP